MKTNDLLDIIGEANDEFIHDAKANQKQKTVRFPNWAKWSSAIAACLCIVLLGGMGISSYFDSYVESHNIQMYYDTENSDTYSSADVTEEQAAYISIANDIHNKLSAQNFAWYGGCQYDFDTGSIKVGLTDLSDENKATVLSTIENRDVHFVMCDYSYQYLESLYEKIDAKRLILSVLGVERYSISVSENYVRVYLTSADDNAAIYIINELDTIGGAINFRTTRYEYDSGLQVVQNPVYEIEEYAVPENYEPADLYISTTTDLAAYDTHMAECYGEKFLGKGIRLFTFVEGANTEDFGVWYFDYDGTSISRIYSVSKSPKSPDKMLTAWIEAGEVGKAIEALASKTSADSPMYLVQDKEIIYAIIDHTAYYLPDFSVFKPEVSVLPAIDVSDMDTKVIVLPIEE